MVVVGSAVSRCRGRWVRGRWRGRWLCSSRCGCRWLCSSRCGCLGSAVKSLWLSSAAVVVGGCLLALCSSRRCCCWLFLVVVVVVVSFCDRGGGCWFCSGCCGCCSRGEFVVVVVVSWSGNLWCHNRPLLLGFWCFKILQLSTTVSAAKSYSGAEISLMIYLSHKMFLTVNSPIASDQTPQWYLG